MTSLKVRAVRTSAVFGALLVLVAVGFTGAAGAAEPCTDVRIVGLRGSGQGLSPAEHGMGAPLSGVANEIAAQASGAMSLSFKGIDYPALPVSSVVTGRYWSSKNAGKRKLGRYLVRHARACPSMRFVVMGYSQGAHAAGDYFEEAPRQIIDRVSALVMFGDPRFNPSASYAWGTFQPTQAGIQSPSRDTQAFSGWDDRVFSFCNRGDIVCQGWRRGNGSEAHTSDAYIEAYGYFAAALVRNALGLERSSRTPLDLAFVIDTTGSMHDSINGARDAVRSMVETFESRRTDFQVGLVEYRDTDQDDEFASRTAQGLTRDLDAFRTALGGLEAVGGGDHEEAVYSGLMTAFDELNWRGSARKAVVLIGDAPAKDPEPVTGYTRETVLERARSLRASGADASSAGVAASGKGSSTRAVQSALAPPSGTGLGPASIYAIPVYDAAAESFEDLAGASGGSSFPAFDPGEVSSEVAAVVEEASTPIFANLTATERVRPGMPVYFSAAGSFYDGGEITSFDWDLDGDGRIDETTTGNRLTHTYPGETEVRASVTVRGSDGATAKSFADVTVSDDVPVRSSGPRGLRVQPDPARRAANIAWRPPLDSGGGAVRGYSLRIDRKGVDRPWTTATVGGNRARIPGIVPGRYHVRVSAINEAGASDPIVRKFVVTRKGLAYAGPVIRLRGRVGRIRLRCIGRTPCRGATGVVVRRTVGSRRTSHTLGIARWHIPVGRSRTVTVPIRRRYVRALYRMRGNIRVIVTGPGSMPRQSHVR